MAIMMADKMAAERVAEKAAPEVEMRVIPMVGTMDTTTVEATAAWPAGRWVSELDAMTVAWTAARMVEMWAAARGTPLVDKMVAILAESLACEAVAMMASKPAA